MNQTLEKFGYLDNVISEYDNWVVMLRPKQITLGSLVIAEKSEATELPEISPESFKELQKVTSDVEKFLRGTLGAEKINYLMLMLVDPNVHYHVFPRYSGEANYAGMASIDKGWGGLPTLSEPLDLPAESWQKLHDTIKQNWPK